MSNLTPELQKQIADEADLYGFVVPYNNSKSFYIEDKVKGYAAGATPYAIKWQEAEQKIKELEQWKKEAALLLDPLLTWGQAQKDILVGCDITKEILRRAKLFGRYEKALKEIQAEHADLNLALAAMLNGYQNLSMYQKDWFTVPKDLINTYTKMVLEYDTHKPTTYDTVNG